MRETAGGDIERFRSKHDPTPCNARLSMLKWIRVWVDRRERLLIGRTDLIDGIFFQIFLCNCRGGIRARAN